MPQKIRVYGWQCHYNYKWKTKHSSRQNSAWLIRGTERYRILGIIDEVNEGVDAGELLDGQKRGIHVYKDLEQFLANSQEKAKYCVIGVGFPGGNFPEELLPEIKKAMNAGMSIVSGLHEYLSEKSELADFAKKKGVQLIDIRKPKPRGDLHFWSGIVKNVALNQNCNAWL